MITDLDARLRARLRQELLRVLPEIDSVCPDSQCGDSTWDHECQLGRSHPNEELADKVLRAMEITIIDQALALIHDFPALFAADGSEDWIVRALRWHRDAEIVDAAKELCQAWDRARHHSVAPEHFAAIERAQERLAAVVASLR